MATEKEVKTIMRDLAKVYPERVRDVGPEGWDAMCGIYWEILRDIPTELLHAAARQCMATLRFFPKPAELRDKALEIIMMTLGIPNANDAWAEVSKRLTGRFRWRQIQGKMQLEIIGMLVETEGGYLRERQPVDSDWSTPLIQRAIDGIGGWAALRASENVIADRSQFLRAYEAYAMREVEQARLLPETRAAMLEWRRAHKDQPLPVALVAGRELEED
jgi:hypothetical protein